MERDAHAAFGRIRLFLDDLNLVLGRLPAVPPIGLFDGQNHPFDQLGMQPQTFAHISNMTVRRGHPTRRSKSWRKKHLQPVLDRPRQSASCWPVDSSKQRATTFRLFDVLQPAVDQAALASHLERDEFQRLFSPNRPTKQSRAWKRNQTRGRPHNFQPPHCLPSVPSRVQYMQIHPQDQMFPRSVAKHTTSQPICSYHRSREESEVDDNEDLSLEYHSDQDQSEWDDRSDLDIMLGSEANHPFFGMYGNEKEGLGCDDNRDINEENNEANTDDETNLVDAYLATDQNINNFSNLVPIDYQPEIEHCHNPHSFQPSQDSHEHPDYTSDTIEGINDPNHSNDSNHNIILDNDQVFGIESDGGGYNNIDKASGEFTEQMDDHFDDGDGFDRSDGVEDVFDDGGFNDVGFDDDGFDDGGFDGGGFDDGGFNDGGFDDGGDEYYQEEDFYGYDKDPY